MDTRTGRILRLDVMELLHRRDMRQAPYLREMVIPPTPAQKRRGRVGRNEPCPCGSGKKFKRCCFRG